jgi:hypothetical protein
MILKCRPLTFTPDRRGHYGEHHVVHRPSTILANDLNVCHRNLAPRDLLRSTANLVEWQTLRWRGKFRHQMNDVFGPAIGGAGDQFLGNIHYFGLRGERSLHE